MLHIILVDTSIGQWHNVKQSKWLTGKKKLTWRTVGRAEAADERNVS